MTEPERRRRRPAVSCQRCKRSKIRCDRETPCSNCVRAKGSTACIYQSHASQPQNQRQHLGQGQMTESGALKRPHMSTPVNRTSSTSAESVVPSHPSSSLEASSTNVSTPASQPSALDVEYMKSQIRKLEEQVSKVVPAPTQPPSSVSEIETSSSRLGGTFHVHRESTSFGQSLAISRSVTHKSRTFGQSHWINLFPLFQGIPLITAPVEPSLRDDAAKVLSNMQRCKSLARSIKFQRSPPWPSPPTADLPPKDVADELVDCYLRTTETIHRILHVPTFRMDYEKLWASDTKPDMAFLVQVKLVLAIGTLTYDEQFSLRTSAIRWVYEGQTWLSEPKFKSRLGIQLLQTDLLLLLAQETVGVGGEPPWISAGALLRRAMYMGFHRDPERLPNKTIFDNEMHRRLWNTILEVTIQSSLTSGGSPLVSLDDFDTKPPRNFDDDQLMAEDPVPKQELDFTKMSVAIALRKIFPIRLAVTKFLNDLKSHGTYDETLRLDTELRASFKTLSRTLQACNSITRSSSWRFETSAVDFIMHRYLSSLHIPFFGPALHETAYAFSRKVVVETALKIWWAAHPSSYIMMARSSSNTSPDRDDLARLIACGSGFYRTVAFQAILIIYVELMTQLQEDESLGPLPLRPDLLSVLDDAKNWCWKCFRAGETNIKGYLLTSVLAAKIDGLMRGVGKDEIPRLLIKAAEDAGAICLPILEEMAARETGESLHQASLNMPFEVVEDWDFMMSDTLFNLGSTEPMSWMFKDEAMQEPLHW